MAAPDNGDIGTDSVVARLNRQLAYFPHEKIYIQTDKSNYLTGERIWFRSHMVDALTHMPTYMSRYIYMELFNPFDELISRIKVRLDNNGVYSGHIDLDDTLPEGSYTIRAYTRYMQNYSNESFYKKSINLLDPYSLNIEPQPDFDVQGNRVNASFTFVDRQRGETITPEIVTYKLPGESAKTIKPNSKSEFKFRFTLSAENKNRKLLLSLIHNGRTYHRYYSIPYETGDYDVSFHPEGGWLIPGTLCRVGFKAINPSGLGENVTGKLYNSKDEEIVSFKTLKHGIGFFDFIPRKDEIYHAICSNSSGDEKQFDLPLPEPLARTINVKSLTGRFIIYLQKGEFAPDDSLSLLIHHKGIALYHQPILPEDDGYIFLTDFFPSGITSLLLLNGDNEILSERLLFNIRDDDFTKVEELFSSPTYKRREPVFLTLQVADIATDSLFNATIAVAVTDKNAVPPDTMTSLPSILLLSSELKGHIESPASYLSGNREDKNALDILMLTQGWRRYDIPKVLKGEIAAPEIMPEQYQAISGRAEARLFRSMEDGTISLYAILDTLTSMEITTADEKGRFTFQTDFPNGTEITVQSLSKKGSMNNFITLDSVSYPDFNFATLPVREMLVGVDGSEEQFDIDAYLKQANEEYLQKYGVRTIMLDEITVTASRIKQVVKSDYYSPIFSSTPTTSEDIDKMNIGNMTALLGFTSGIAIRAGGTVTSTQSDLPLLIVLDNIPWEQFDVFSLDVSDIDNLFVIKGSNAMFGYYPGTSGALVINTKTGSWERVKSTNIDKIIPLGYQQPAEFYSPKYETEQQINSSQTDMRTTIFWKPNVLFSPTGEAIIEFYSADTPTTYQIRGEGVDSAGKLIYFNKEVVIESSVK